MSRNLVVQLFYSNTPGTGVRETLGDSSGDRAQFGFCRGDCHALLQSSNHEQPAKIPILFVHRFVGIRPPYVRIRLSHGPAGHPYGLQETKSIGKNADDRVDVAIERDLTSDDTGIGSKTPTPKPFAKNKDKMFSKFFFFRQKGPPQHRSNAQDVKEIGAGHPCLQSFRGAFADQVEICGSDGRETLE